MDRIAGLLCKDVPKKLQSSKWLQKASRNLNVYFYADSDSQLATICPDRSSNLCRQIVWSGEIHNKNEIVRFLNKSGISVGNNASDAQLSLNLYDIVGFKAPIYIIGYFAFAIWDELTRNLFLSRDALGAKRLYYFYNHNLFGWGSEIRQLCFLTETNPILNEAWIAEALTWPWDGCLVHTKDSPIKDVQAVPPGHSLLLNYGKQPQITQWWEWNIYRGGNCSNEDDLIEEFRSLLISSVKDCLGNDNRIIADLSGGLDSSSVVSIACYLAEKGESSVSLRNVISLYDQTEPGFDEIRYQETVVTRYGLNWHKVPLEGCWFLAGIREQNTYFDYPTPILLWLKCAKKPLDYIAENDFVVSLTGGGGDHVMPPTSLYLFDYMLSGKIKEAWKDIVVFSQMRARPLWKIIADEILSPIKYLRNLWEPEIPTWLDEDFLKRTNLKARFYDQHRDLRGYPLSSQLDMIAIKWNLDRIFTTAQYVASPIGIDIRHPFMDRRLINFTLQLPPHLKRQPKQAKYILRQAMKGILPETVRLRTGKTTFSHLRHRGLINEADYFNEIKKNPVLAQLGYIDLNRWREAMTRYELGIVRPWKPFRPSVRLDSPLAVEVWLRTCFPQLNRISSFEKPGINIR